MEAVIEENKKRKEQFGNFENWTKEMINSPFVEASQPEGKTVNVNGSDMSWAMWNLIVSKRDISLYAKCNMKPNRFWKVSDVKWYFGIKGNGQNLLKQFMIIFDTVIKFEEEETKKK